MPINERSAAPLLEVQRRAGLIADAIAGTSYGQYLAEPQLQAIVERHLEVIGEALNRIARSDPYTASRIFDLRGFVSLRNVISHQYDKLVYETVWETVTDELPLLVTDITTLLRELGDDQ